MRLLPLGLILVSCATTPDVPDTRTCPEVCADNFEDCTSRARKRQRRNDSSAAMANAFSRTNKHRSRNTYGMDADVCAARYESCRVRCEAAQVTK
jgi:hypothetical protein